MPKMQIQFRILIKASVAVLVLTFASVTYGKSLSSKQESSSSQESARENLIALPSEYKSSSTRVYSSEPYTLMQPAEPTSGHLIHYQPSGPQEHATVSHHTNGGVEKQQVVYEIRHEPQAQQVVHYVDAKQQQQRPHNPDCQNAAHQHVETVSYEQQQPASQAEHETRVEYHHGGSGQPEIVYMNPELEGARISEPQGNHKTIAGIERVASELMQSSGMPATILTEVPARDMPQEVLDRLRQDYGVKVVATRERPGANLIINCDDYSNAASPVCQRSSPYNTANDISAFTVTDASVHPGYTLQDQEATSAARGESIGVGDGSQGQYGADSSSQLEPQPEPHYHRLQSTATTGAAEGDTSYVTSSDQSDGYPSSSPNVDQTSGAQATTAADSYPSEGAFEEQESKRSEKIRKTESSKD